MLNRTKHHTPKTPVGCTDYSHMGLRHCKNDFTLEIILRWLFFVYHFQEATLVSLHSLKCYIPFILDSGQMPYPHKIHSAPHDATLPQRKAVTKLHPNPHTNIHTSNFFWSSYAHEDLFPTFSFQKNSPTQIVRFSKPSLNQPITELGIEMTQPPF